MKFSEFQAKVEKYPCFSVSELKLLLSKDFNRTLQNQLRQWVDLKYIIKLKRGLYLLNRTDLFKNLDPAFFAEKIYSPSYVSLEYALSFYGIIPEAVNTITSISTRKTNLFKNRLGEFSFQHLKKETFLGFETRKTDFISYNFATREKALVDYFYFNKEKIKLTKDFWDSMRYNLDKNFKLNKLKYYSAFFDNKKLEKIVLNFIEYARLKFY